MVNPAGKIIESLPPALTPEGALRVAMRVTSLIGGALNFAVAGLAVERSIEQSKPADLAIAVGLVALGAVGVAVGEALKEE